MELRHLEYFVAVADEASFTRAAARLHIVQSAVSAGVAALERDLGARVFDRTSRTVTLNAAGAALLPPARETLAAAQRAVDSVGEVRGGVRGHLRIGTMTSTGILNLPELLAGFRRLHPLVTLSLTMRPGGSRELVQALTQGALDIAVLSGTSGSLREVHVVELIDEPMCALVPGGHPLARLTEVDLSAMAGLEFVDFPVGYGSRDVVDRAFDRANVTRAVTLEIGDSRTVADYVRHGLGVAIVARAIVGDVHGLACLDMSDAGLTWPLLVARARNRPTSAASRAFEALLLDFVATRLKERVRGWTRDPSSIFSSGQTAPAASDYGRDHGSASVWRAWSASSRETYPHAAQNDTSETVILRGHWLLQPVMVENLATIWAGLSCGLPVLVDQSCERGPAVNRGGRDGEAGDAVRDVDPEQPPPVEPFQDHLARARRRRDTGRRVMGVLVHAVT